MTCFEEFPGNFSRTIVPVTDSSEILEKFSRICPKFRFLRDQKLKMSFEKFLRFSPEFSHVNLLPMVSSKHFILKSYMLSIWFPLINELMRTKKGFKSIFFLIIHVLRSHKVAAIMSREFNHIRLRLDTTLRNYNDSNIDISYISDVFDPLIRIRLPFHSCMPVH